MTFVGFVLGIQVLLVSPYVMQTACPHDIGCYSSTTQTILLDNTLIGDEMTFALWHEVGHAYLQTMDEDKANEFANSMMI